MTLSTAQHVPLGRYELATETKVTGATYTPKVLADFVAQQIVSNAQIDDSRPLHVLDPAVGDGELLLALVRAIRWKSQVHLHVHGFETDARAVAVAVRRLSDAHPDVVLSLKQSDFLEHVLDAPRRGRTGSLFGGADPLEYDLVIANPPYVRTQILGAVQAKRLAESFGLSGRVDLYYAFLAALGDVLRPGGVAGVIVSNRVMTTKAGAPVRAALRANHRLLSLYDFGDTKLFAAAVLPAVLVFAANGPQSGHAPAFTSIYETEDPAESDALDAIEALQRHGVVRLADGRSFRVQTLNSLLKKI